MRSKHLLLMLLLALMAPWAVAQDVADYTFSTGTSATQWITLSNSAQTLIASGKDDEASSKTNIGFSFPFGNGTYTQFWANSNGIFSFNSTTSTARANQFTSSNCGSNNPKICGVTKDLTTGSDGYVKYELTGTAPNRILVCEFKTTPSYTSSYSSTTADVMWQVQLYEADSKVVIVYGTAPASNPSSYQIGLGQSGTDFWVVDPSTHEAAHLTSGVSTTYSVWPGANRYYQFARPVICCPNPQNLACTATTGTPATATFTWTNGGEETQWQLEYSTASNFTNASTATITQSQLVEGAYTLSTDLTAETNYYARIKAYCPSCDPNYSEWSNVIEFKPSNSFCNEIGTGTSTANLVYTSYGCTYSQHIYTATELTEMGFTAGDIVSVSFYYSGTSSYYDKTQSIYMGTTTKSSYAGGTASDFESDVTLVYGPTLLSYVAGWREYELTEPFEWDGTSNIVVGMLTNSTASSSSGWDAYGTSTSPDYRTIFRYQDSNPIDITNLASVAYGNRSTTRPNINLCISTPKPKNLTVSNITNESATATWEAPTTATPTGYRYQYKPEGGTWTTLTSPTALSANLTGLTSNTEYTFQVKAIYSDGESEFATKTFTTLCDPYAIPYEYSFESDEIEDMECWTISDIYNSCGVLPYADYARTGSSSFLFNYVDYPSTNPQYMTLITPELSGIVDGLHVEFYYRATNSYVETFRVGYSTTDKNLNSFTWGSEITSETADYQLFKANYPAGTKYVAVQYLSDDKYILLLDDFSFTEAPSCLEPSDIIVSSITTTGANLSWTVGGEETAWDIFVTNDATAVPNDGTTSTYANVATHTNYPISGLTSGTTYYVYVRSACSATEHSEWSTPATFNTVCEAMPLPYTYDFEDDDLPVCWSTINTNDSYNHVGIMNLSSNKVLAFYMGTYVTATLAAVLPEVDAAYPLNEYEITFKAGYANSSSTTMTSGKLRIGIMTNPNDFSTFTQIKEVDITDPYTAMSTHTVRFNTYTGTGHYIAIQDYRTDNGYVLVDDVEVKHLPACLEPSDPVVSEITNHTAKVDWTGTSAGYNIDYRTAATIDPVLEEGFEHSGSMPEGWTHIGSGSTNITSSSSRVHTGTYSLIFSGATSNNVIVLPDLGVEANTLTLSFWSLAESGTSSGTFQVGYVTSATDATTFQQVGSYNASEYTSYKEVNNVSLASVPAGARIAFRHTSASSSYYWWIDDIVIGSPVAAGAWQHTTSTTNTKTLTGLLAQKKYEVRVQGDCGSEGTSEWSDIVSFTTDIPCPAPTGLTASNPKSSSIDLSWTKSYADAWQVCYNDGTDHTVDVATDDVTIEEGVVTYTLTSLTEETDYTVKVRENCGSTDGYSEWTTPDVAFSTIAACAVDNVVVSNITHHTATVNWDGESEDHFSVYVGQYAAAQTYIEKDFEDETIPDGWTNNSTNPWTVVEGNNGHCIKSGNAGVASSTSEISFSYNFSEAGRIEFDALCQGEGTSSIYDHCDFYIDSDRKLYAGEQIPGWNHYGFNVAAGTHTFKWSYTKDSSVNKEGDAFSVDNIVVMKPTETWGAPIVVNENEYAISGLTAGTEYLVKVVPNCNETLASEIQQFTTVSPHQKWFITEGNWGTAANWEPEGAPTIEQDVVLKANATITIESGVAYAKSIAGTGTGTDAKTLTIEDGGKLKHTSGSVRATVKKTITGYTNYEGEGNGGYYLIANPTTSNYTPNSEGNDGILAGNYDLYSFDYTQADEWRNFKVTPKPFSSLSSGLYGYLYANQAGTTLSFTGTINPYTSYKSRSLTASGSTTQDFPGWYLLGNPYMYDAYLVNNSSNGTALPYVKMNADGDGFENVPAGTPIEPMTGFFYQATADGYVYVHTTAPTVTDAGLLNMNLRSGSKQLDNAIVAFGSEQRLEKFSFRANSSKIYMPVEGKDYAITNAEPQGEMPVSFKAENNGSYTLSFNTENVEFGYLHLIDNMTGEDVNLLETPSYSFEAKTTDYASRFRLVFSTGNGVNEESFAFISDGNIILNGEGMLQVVDVMGRIMMQEENATSVSTNGMTPGVYVLRLINGDSVRTQKIVIK